MLNKDKKKVVCCTFFWRCWWFEINTLSITVFAEMCCVWVLKILTIEFLSFLFKRIKRTLNWIDFSTLKVKKKIPKATEETGHERKEDIFNELVFKSTCCTFLKHTFSPLFRTVRVYPSTMPSFQNIKKDTTTTAQILFFFLVVGRTVAWLCLAFYWKYKVLFLLLHFLFIFVWYFG